MIKSENSVFHLKAIAILISGCFAASLVGCASVSPNASAQGKKERKDCSSTGQYIGTGVGAGIGWLVADQLGVGQLGKVAIVLGSAYLGNVVGAQVDRRHCEIDNIANAHGVEILTAKVELKDDGSDVLYSDTPSSGLAAKTVQSTGVVDIVRLSGSGHFASGSDKLTAKAQKYFSEIADQYSENTATLQSLDLIAAKEKAKGKTLSEADRLHTSNDLKQSFRLRPIVLIGHTDDTGDSLRNQQLSEKRAHVVAELFKAHGIASSRIYFKGAGDSDPVTDNRTEDGRSTNRRVEIVEFESVEKLNKFIAMKKDNTNYFRPKQTPLRPILAKDESQLTTSVNSSVKKNKMNVDRMSASEDNGQAVHRQNESGKSKRVKGNDPAYAKMGKSTTPKSGVDFGGSQASGDIDSTIREAMGKAIQPEKSAMASMGGWFVKEAKADDSDDRKVYDLPCTADAPRYGGQYVSLQTGKIVGADTKTADYAPGMYQTSWVGVVNGNYLGITPVGVLRANFQPASHPNLLVYANTIAPGAMAKSSMTIPMQVNVYPGEQGILYRMYATGDANLVCADVILPRRVPFTALAGKLYYKHQGQVFENNFIPSMLATTPITN